MPDERITTEDLAEELGATPQAIYESRRRKEYPGKLGHRQGRRLFFHRSEVNDWLESVPEQVSDGTGAVLRWRTDPAYGEGETTENATQAILWALSGIHTTLRAIENELRAQRAILAPLATPQGYIGYEDDESLDEIRKAWERGEKGITMRPTGNVHFDGNTFTEGDEEE